ncbi:unnamed protein product [Parnassius mnemosyne]|uniref:Uncharacterized protein n=1 Tax=Parnassius mnemosyne TaxID=213953 RepID=A0AAV1KX15_9NEOP
MFTCGSCGHKSALSNDALKHSRICKRGKRNEPATIKVKKSNCDVSDAVAPAPRAPDAPKRGRGRPRKRMSNFMREKNLDKKNFKPKRDVSRPRPVFKPQLTLAEQQLQIQRTRGRPPKNYYNRKKDIHKKPSLIMQGTLDNSTFQNMETVELQNLEDSSSEFITGSLSPILQSDEDANRNLSSPLYGFSEPTKIVFNPLADVHHSLFHDENNSQEEPEVIVPHFVEQTQMEPEEHVPTVAMETTIVSEKDSRIVKPIPNKEDIHDKTGQVQMEANLESTSTTSPSIITSIISLNDNVQRPVEHT